MYVLDTSAWLKRYIEEPSCEYIDELFERAKRGGIEVCWLPIVYYEICMRFVRVHNTIRNRSASNALRLRLPLDVLESELNSDLSLCKPIGNYIPDMPNSLHLFQVDARVVKYMQTHSIGANDALILVCLEELVRHLLAQSRPVYFVCFDKRLLMAAGQVEGLKVEPKSVHHSLNDV